MHHIGVELTASNRRMLYIPSGCAHGFLTLADESEVCYQMSDYHAPETASGVRWDDPAFDIAWPMAVRVISERDRCYEDFKGSADSRVFPVLAESLVSR
jgi:dTDP-4-dehydrorhamnose 3,5-epimerase